jgi:hypothetical protein
MLIDAQRSELRICPLLRPDRYTCANQEKNRHCTKQGPSLPTVSCHLAEGVSQACADRKNCYHLEQIG